MSAALVVVDVQNDFKRGVSEYECPMLNDRLLKRIGQLVLFCRKKSIPIIFTRHTILSNKVNAEIGEPDNVRACIKGTYGWQVAQEANPLESDIYVDKDRFDAFYKTNLEFFLRNMGVDTVIICGVWTNNCIRATAEGAYYRNYKIILISDCCGARDFVGNADETVNWFTLLEFQKRTYLTKVLSLNELKKSWKNLKSP